MRVSSALALAAVLAATHAAHAVNVFWDDGGPDKNWSTAANWDGNTLPGSSDDIFIGNLAAAAGDSTIVDADFAAENLTITNAADVDTDGNLLKLSGDLAVSGAGSFFTMEALASDPGEAAVLAHNATVGLGANLIMNGGRMVLSDPAPGAAAITLADLIIGSGSLFAGYGSLEFDDNYTTAFSPLINEGSLFTRRGAGLLSDRFTLSIDSTGGTADLDGFTNGGAVNVVQQTTLDLNDPLADFHGTMTLAPGAIFDSQNDWTNNGLISVDAGTTTAGVAPEGTITGGQMTVGSGGIVSVVDGAVAFDTTTDFQAGSLLRLFSDAGAVFDAPSTIDGDLSILGTSSGVTLDVNAVVTINTSSFDWDGAEDSVTNVSQSGDLRINASDISPSAVDDSFDGTLNIDGGRVDADVAGGWEMGGTVNLQGGAAFPTAVLTGSTMTVANGGAVNVLAGFASLSGPTVFESGSSTDVSATNTGTLLVNGDVTFEGGSSHTGAGEVRFIDNAIVVNGATTIDMTGDVLLDADSTDHDTTLTLNNDLTVNANTVGTFGAASAVAGTDSIFVNSSNAELTINQSGASSWTLGADGVISINGSGTITTTLDGDDLVVDGLINVINTTRVGARLDVGATGELRANTNTLPVTPQLRLGGGTLANPNTISGGQITAGGEIVAENGKALRGFGSIGADVRFLGNAELIAEGGQLVVNGAVLDAGVVGVGGGGSQLGLQQNFNSTTNGSTIELAGGLITAPAGVTNGTTIEGFGSFTPASLLNNGLIRATGGTGETLTISTSGGAAVDLDGSGLLGDLEAVQGNLTISESLTDAFGGEAAVGSQMSLNFQQGWTLGTNGTLTFQGSGINFAVVSGTNSQIDGAVSVLVNGRISGPSTIGDTATVDIPGSQERLQLSFGDSLIEAGAKFTGAGLLSFSGGPTMVTTLEDGVDIDVDVGSARAVALGVGVLTIASAEVLSFDQSPAGVLRIDIGSSGTGVSDTLVVDTTASLSGALDLMVTGPVTPAYGDTYTVLTSAGLSGTFDQVTGAVFPGPIGWRIDYTATSVVVRVGLDGDFNDDGVVDALDYAVWRETEGQTGGGLLADGDLDGDVDAADYQLWRDNYGRTAAGLSLAVPEPTGLLLLVSAFGAAAIRRRDRVAKVC